MKNKKWGKSDKELDVLVDDGKHPPHVVPICARTHVDATMRRCRDALDRGDLKKAEFLGWWRRSDPSFPQSYDASLCYLRERSNGDEIDNPRIPFPQDGIYTWDDPSRSIICKDPGKSANAAPERWIYGYIRYTEGVGDRAWMEEKDRNYILRLNLEGRLLELESHADEEIAPDHYYRDEIIRILREARARAGGGIEAQQSAIELGRLSISFVIPYSELTLRTEIGSGGFGIVYRGAYQGATVAIKQLRTIMSDEAKGEFRHEAEIMFRLRHPNIVPLFGICTEPGHYCMVMQYATNGSLYQFLHSSQPLEWPLRWNIALDVARGILYLHTQNILHRDLKSHNILLDGSMRAKITDFGLARVKAESRTAYYGGVMGTPQWMAPELLDMESGSRVRYSKASDIYAFAIILLEIATRKIPYDGMFPLLMIGFVVNGRREDIPSECPSQYAATIRRCWAQRAEDRPSIENVVRDLEAGRSVP